jgi:hypothetical protein
MSYDFREVGTIANKRGHKFLTKLMTKGFESTTMKQKGVNELFSGHEDEDTIDISYSNSYVESVVGAVDNVYNVDTYTLHEFEKDCVVVWELIVSEAYAIEIKNQVLRSCLFKLYFK